MNPVLQSKLKRNALIIAILLLIPLALTLLNTDPNDGWRWKSPGDYVFGFLVPFIGALVYELIVLKVTKNSHRLVVAIAVTLLVCAFWAEMATGGVSRAVANILS